MIETLTFRARDRVLLIAPHPDDESIATGGLVQVVLDTGAALRVLVLTDGDNNPWPQRWLEKRWRIGAADRARWGARRRLEAMAAMRILGCPLESVRFLGLPDLGIQQRLMRSDPAVIDRLCQEITVFRPDWLVVPDFCDRHPDHSAAFVLTDTALRAAGSCARVLAFAVHGGGGSGQDTVAVPLDETRLARKRVAIEAHTSQMCLSRRRFLRYAQPREWYRAVSLPPQPRPDHPLRARAVDSGKLEIRIDLRAYGCKSRGESLFVVLDDGRRYTIALDRLQGALSVANGTGEPMPANAQARREAAALVTTIELPKPVTCAGFVKLGRAAPGLWVLDRWGWQPIARG